VPGVDKRLILIEPTVKGHIESSIIGRESEVAKILGVSVDIIKERINVLLRRDKIGRTGVYLKRELSPHETFGEVLKKIADRDPIVRRRILKDEGVK
ncbi:MAG: nucleotidyltransferase domain-containing protein, partial [Candidatus Baldrarchaeia archaeon]